jgi:flagellar motor switch protein FliM
VEGILSQDEVDALLDGGGDGEPAAAAAENNSSVRSYDMASQERIVRGRMPTLEIIHERFARNLRIGMFNFMRRTPEISIGTIRILKYSAFLRELILPSNLNLVSLKPLRGNCLFIFEPTLVFAVIDCLFGGNGKLHARIEGREFTATELRIIQRMLDMALKEYVTAWTPTYKLAMEYVRSEMQPQFANIATPSEVVVAVKFDMDLGDVGGAIHICIPYSSIEPIRDLLFSSTQSDAGEIDTRWVSLLSREMQAAELELVAMFASANVTLNQVLKMRPGDVIGLDAPEQIQLAVHGVPIIEGRVGTLKDRYAIQVDRVLSSRGNENGENHAV